MAGKGGRNNRRRVAAAAKGKTALRRTGPPAVPKKRSPSKRTYSELLEETGDLPDSYGATTLVLLPVHPYLVHAYWEVREGDLRKAAARLRTRQKLLQPTLRFYDVTGIVFDGTNAHRFFDIDVDLRTQNWYVHLWSPDKWYIAEIGLRSVSGNFVAVARSQAVELPPDEPSEQAEESYLLVLGDYDLVESVAGAPADYLPSETAADSEPFESPVAEAGGRGVWRHDLVQEETHDTPEVEAEIHRKDRIARERQTYPPTSSLPPPRASFSSRRAHRGPDLISMVEQEFLPGIASNGQWAARES